MNNKNNIIQTAVFKPFVLLAISIILCSFFVGFAGLYYNDKIGFENWFLGIKQQRVQQLQKIRSSVAKISCCIDKSSSKDNPDNMQSIRLARAFLSQKQYSASILVDQHSSPYPGLVDECHWVEINWPKPTGVAVRIPTQSAKYISLYSYDVSGSAIGMSSYQLFDKYQTNYNVARRLNYLVIIKLLGLCVLIGLASSAILIYSNRYRKLQTVLKNSLELQSELQRYKQKEIHLKDRVDSLNLWYKAHVYELQSTFDGVKQMGSSLNSLWQVLHTHFNELEPQYKKFMCEIQDIVDNLANGFISPPCEDQEISVDECLRKIFDGKHEELRLANLQLEFYAPEDPMLLTCAASALKQVLHGLVSYAIRLTPAGCSIKVRFNENSIEIEHYGFVIKSSDYSYRNSFLSLSLTSLSYLCKKNNWSLLHKLSGPKGSQGGVFLLSFNNSAEHSIRLVHNAAKIKK